MAIRVLIEREVDPGQEGKLQALLMQVRGKAINAKGYISGETLRAANKPNKFLVISTWNSLDEWNEWQASADRKDFQASLNKLLLTPEKTAVYDYL